MDLSFERTIKVFSLCAFIFVASCSDDTQSASSADPDIGIIKPDSEMVHPFDVNLYKMNKVVCDPMGGPGNPGQDSGLIAELFYLDSTQPHYNRVQDYFNFGQASSQDLFFTALDIPTRVFDTGFPSETGNIIKDDLGGDLYEYFAIRFKSTLQLGPDDEEGDYELAILSDDGTVLTLIDAEGQESVLVDNDGDHPTRMGCGETISMTEDTVLDVRLSYYQGPRYHISLIPLWRKVDQSTQPEPECGKKGNRRYFDYDNNSTPQQAYLNMLDRGWKPIGAQNWKLPISAIFNPCQDGTPAIISNFAVQKVDEEKALVTWTTDRPATSQVLWKDSQGNENLTDADNILRTSHSVLIDSGIIVGNTYTFQGLSITADMGKSLSRVLEVTF
jgi:hypothetical protein